MSLQRLGSYLLSGCHEPRLLPQIAGLLFHLWSRSCIPGPRLIGAFIFVITKENIPDRTGTIHPLQRPKLYGRDCSGPIFPIPSRATFKDVPWPVGFVQSKAPLSVQTSPANPVTPSKHGQDCAPLFPQLQSHLHTAPLPVAQDVKRFQPGWDFIEP